MCPRGFGVPTICVTLSARCHLGAIVSRCGQKANVDAQPSVMDEIAALLQTQRERTVSASLPSSFYAVFSRRARLLRLRDELVSRDSVRFRLEVDHQTVT